MNKESVVLQLTYIAVGHRQQVYGRSPQKWVIRSAQSHAVQRNVYSVISSFAHLQE
jgi:hypothetical protein